MPARLTSHDPGRLGDYLVPRYPVSNRDALGQDVPDWVESEGIWAELSPLAGREAVEAGALKSIATSSALIRRHDTLAADWKLTDEAGQVYEILHVAPWGANYQRLLLRLVDPAVTEADPMKRALISLDAADESKAVTFATAFASAPTYVNATILAPDGTAAGIACWPDESTRTTTGITFRFAAAIPASGYKLSYLAAA